MQFPPNCLQWTHSHTHSEILPKYSRSNPADSLVLRNGKTDRRALERLARELKEADNVQMEAESVKKPPTVPTATLPVTVPPPAYQLDSKEVDIEALTAPSINRTPHAKTIGSSSVTELGSEVSSLAKREYPWSGYEDDALPDKTQGKVARNLRHQIFTLYRRLFGVVFLTNMGVFISVVMRGADAQQIATIVIANLFCSILMRQDYVINAFFNVFCAVPPS